MLIMCTVVTQHNHERDYTQLVRPSTAPKSKQTLNTSRETPREITRYRIDTQIARDYKLGHESPLSPPREYRWGLELRKALKIVKRENRE